MASKGRWIVFGIAVIVLLAIPYVAKSQETTDPPTCFGRPATIVGTAEADELRGTPAPDTISAGAGSDEIFGLGSGDRICAGDGDDRVSGGLGTDRILGGAGDDVISGETGSDKISGGPGVDTIRGGRGNDRLSGGAGDGDLVYGDLGDDRVRGGPGNRDQASGGLGIDNVNGGPGDFDLVSGDYGYDRMSGGPGKHDIASFASAIAGPDGKGVSVNLRRGRAGGDGIDYLHAFEDIEGSAFADKIRGDRHDNLIDAGPGDDDVFGAGGADVIDGDQGTDRCRGGALVDCGREPDIKAPLYVQIDRSPIGGGGLAIVGFKQGSTETVAFDPVVQLFTVFSKGPVAIGDGCFRLDGGMTDVACQATGVVRGLVADLGAGNDHLKVAGGLAGVDSVRISGGLGNDVLRGGRGSELIEAGAGVDRLYGGKGSDGLIGGIPGADSLYGGPGGDLLAAGSACIGGRLVGGSGRDNASFAETPAHPGVLNASLARGNAFIKAVRGCRPVSLAASDEDLEGSFDWDILIGDGGSNVIFGQPGRDFMYGRGGPDNIDARDGERDFGISCGGGRDIGHRDKRDPGARSC